MSETYEEKVEKINLKHITDALDYIINEKIEGNHGIFYVYTNPQRWSVVRGQKYVGLKDTLRVAYLFAIQDSPEGGAFSKKQLQKLTSHRVWTTGQAKSFLTRKGVRDFHNFQSGEEGESGYVKMIEMLHQFKQIILHGPPGTGKTYSAQQVLPELLKVESEDLEELQNNRWDIVQFHPSYNYEDFVRGIKVGTTSEGQIKYETKNHIFGEMCKRAKDNESHDYALIIDEINRANVSAVLGELIYALEYRGKNIKTPYVIDGNDDDGCYISVPKNLYIIGTMNNADRTIGQIDYAVRRRFAFVHCSPKRSVIEEKVKNFKDACSFFDAVKGVFKDISPDFDVNDVCIGHSYFLAEGDELARKILYQVVPILREYVKDGVLLEGAKNSIKKIEESVQEISGNLTLGVPPSAPISSTSGESGSSKPGSGNPSNRLFFWGRDNRYQLNRIGRTALSIVQDYVAHSRPNNLAELQKWLPDAGKDSKSRGIKQWGEIEDIDKGRFFMGDGEKIEIANKTAYLTHEWGKDKVFDDFVVGVEKDGYHVRQCHFVNVGEGINARSHWDFCNKCKFLSTSKIMENENTYDDDLRKLKDGDIVIAFVVVPGAGNLTLREYVGLGRIFEGASLIRDFQVGDVPLLKCEDDHGRKYNDLRPDKSGITVGHKLSEWCIGIKWIQTVNWPGVPADLIKSKFKKE